MKVIKTTQEELRAQEELRKIREADRKGLAEKFFNDRTK